MSDLCSPRKSNGLLNYFTRLEPAKRTVPSNSGGQNQESPNSVSPLDNDIEIVRGAQNETEEVEKEDTVTSGAKRKRSYTKRGSRQSDGSNTRTLRQRHQSDTHKNDSDSDFEQKETVKRPKRKFTSVPNGVKSISSYFSLSSGSQQSNQSTEDVEAKEKDAEVQANVIEDAEDKKSMAVEDAEDSEAKATEDAEVIETNAAEVLEIVDSVSSSETGSPIEIIEEVGISENRKVSIEGCNSSASSEENDSEEIKPVMQDTPTRRRSSRIKYIEERKERELEEKEKKRQVEKLTKPARPRKRMQISESESENSVVVDSDQEDRDSSDFIDSEDEEHFQNRRKGKRKSKKVNGKIPLMFLSGKEREKELLRLKKEKEKKPSLDAETLAFLHSGVPDVVLKAQKQVEKKQEFDEYLNTVEFFPKISHTMFVSENMLESSVDLCFKEKSIFDSVPASSCSLKEFFAARKDNLISDTLDNGVFCCGNTSFVSFNSALSLETCESDLSSNHEMPWVEKFKVASKKDLVVDKDAFGKLEKWLKQWKTDIKDDGGTGRKEIRKRRKDSDSDFVTSEDEHDFMNKSVLLCGSTGCGKTTAVYVLAKHLGFYVVEVNFSSRRSGKEVMQSVEEATLSHRLESSESCLLLFKDIDLLHPEEDEGFHAAVAQLISSSCRPIVMTTHEPIYSPLDSKIEKKDPLRIHFNRPSPSEIVRKVLVPMCKSSISNGTVVEEKLFVSGLDSLVRHLHCDIRLSINQAQFLCFDSFFNTQNVHKHCNMIENCIDLDFVRKTKEDKIDQQSTKVDKKKLIKELDKFSKDLSLLSDIELISSKYKSLNDVRDDFTSNLAGNYREYLEQSSKILEFCPKDNCDVKGSKRFDSFENSFDCYRKLSLVNDDEDLLISRGSVLNEELGSYCDDFEDWESRGCVRTIVKSNAINCVGRSAKRNGRMAFYFNRLDKDLVDRICATFGFAQELEIAKIFSPS